MRNAQADQLWDKAHSALLEGRWGEARALVDDMCANHRDHAVDELLTMDDLRRAGRQTPSPAYEPVLQDRISLWNSYVQRNWTQG